MAHPDSHVTIHMAASVDGFIARRDGRVDWMETPDEFAGGETMEPGLVTSLRGAPVGEPRPQCHSFF